MPIFYAQNNIVGTLNMMEAARQNGVKKFGTRPVLPYTAIIPTSKKRALRPCSFLTR
ncbi:MAG: hypothetical protein ACLURV_00190 [Gallintestinimicrobium sp.]